MSEDVSVSDADLLEEFLVDARVQGLTDKTLVTYRSDLEYFIEWLDCDLQEVSCQTEWSDLPAGEKLNELIK